MEKYTLNDRLQACIVLCALNNEVRACRFRVNQAREWQAETGQSDRLDYEKRMFHDTMRLRDRLKRELRRNLWKDNEAVTHTDVKSRL